LSRKIGIVPEQNTQILAQRHESQVLYAAKRQYGGFCMFVRGKGRPVFVGVVPGIWAIADGMNPESLMVI